MPQSYTPEFKKKIIRLHLEDGRTYKSNLHEYQTEDPLYQAVEEFAYVHYNHVRPHSYNGYHTPYQARIAG